MKAVNLATVIMLWTIVAANSLFQAVNNPSLSGLIISPFTSHILRLTYFYPAI